MDILEPKIRLGVLAKIIEKKKPSNQIQIIKFLKDDYGFEMTQAMISRDLKKLGVVMKLEDGKRIYTLPGKDEEMQMLQLAITDIQHNETTIVVSTLAGLAPFVGDVIDRAKLNILGCIAGENAILVVPSETKTIKNVFQELSKALYYLSDSSKIPTEGSL